MALNNKVSNLPPESHDWVREVEAGIGAALSGSESAGVNAKYTADRLARLSLSLSDNAVTTAKIADGNVTTAKIADSAVTTAKIADSNVTTAKMASDSIAQWATGTSGRPVNTTGDVNAANTIASATAQGNVVKTVTGYSVDITTTRRAAWIRQSDGEIAYASSSRDRKDNIRPAELDTDAIRAIGTYLYSYKAELGKQQENPDYHVATEIGVMAEELHELGLWQFVSYDTLDDGTKKPAAVHYEILSLAALELAKTLANKLDTIERRLTTLETNH